MKKHKICIVGGGLTGLISALILSERGLDIDLIVENNVSKIKDLRVTAISEKNMEFLKSTIKNINLKLFYNYTGTEIIRRLIGIAQLPLNSTIEQKRKLLYFSKSLIA